MTILTPGLIFLHLEGKATCFTAVLPCGGSGLQMDFFIFYFCKFDKCLFLDVGCPVTRSRVFFLERTARASPAELGNYCGACQSQEAWLGYLLCSPSLPPSRTHTHPAGHFQYIQRVPKRLAILNKIIIIIIQKRHPPQPLEEVERHLLPSTECNSTMGPLHEGLGQLDLNQSRFRASAPSSP